VRGQIQQPGDLRRGKCALLAEMDERLHLDVREAERARERRSPARHGDVAPVEETLDQLGGQGRLFHCQSDPLIGTGG
jgi:hypothetical protein